MAYYLPGYKAGGALRTARGMIEGLSSAFSFRILTRDRDFEDDAPYPEVSVDTWSPIGDAEIRYLAPASVSPCSFRSLMRESAYDLFYFPSLFDPRFTILPLFLSRLGLVPRVPAIVAPQNELSSGALSLKHRKKRLFLAGARMLGLYRHVTFHASSEMERTEIAAVFPGARIEVARNILLDPEIEPGPRPGTKEAGVLRAVFISRVNAKKNLAGALRMLGTPRLRGQIHFDIYGPIDDPEHWATCQDLIGKLPSHVTAKFHGPIENERLGEILPSYHIFLLPTLGESFGYAILEAMLWGCPVLISDRTPWKGLAARGAGWGLPLEDTDAFLDVLQELIDLDEERFALLSESTQRYALDYVRSKEQVEENRRMLAGAVEAAP